MFRFKVESRNRLGVKIDKSTIVWNGKPKGWSGSLSRISLVYVMKGVNLILRLRRQMRRSLGKFDIRDKRGCI